MSSLEQRVLAALASMLAWTAASPVLAQGDTPSLPRSLVSAIQQASMQRLEAKISDANMQGAEARMTEARSHLYPTLGFSTEIRDTHRWDHFTGISASADVPGSGTTTIDVTSDTPRYQIFPSIEARYDLYAGGRHEAGVRQAEHLMRSADLDKQVSRQKVAFDVSRRYFALRRSCVTWDSAQAAAALSAKNFALSEVRHESGRLSDIEFRAAQAELTEQRQTSNNKALTVRAAYADYASAITDRPVDVADAATACRFDASIQDDLALASSMTEQTPGLQKLESEIHAAHEQIEIEKAASRPNVSLTAVYGYVGRSTSSFSDMFSNINRQEATVGIRMSYNLFDGKLAHAHVDAARADLQRKQLQMELHAAQIEQTRYRSLSDQKEAELATQLARTRLELASARRALAEDQLKSGRGTALAVEEGRLKEHEAENALALAQLDSAIAQLGLRYAEAAAAVGH